MLARLAPVLLAGCSLLPPPQSEPATSILSKVPDQVPFEPGHASTLLVQRPEISSAYDTTRMAYTVKPYEIAYYRDNQWADTPAQMIQPLLVRTLQQTGFFQAILSAPDPGHTSYVLRTEIMELTQDYTRSPPLMRLTLHLRLFDESGRAVAEREITERETMQAATSYAGVNAANEALAKALRGAAEFVMSAAR
jgi:cholesterol transport system auxiliary component